MKNEDRRFLKKVRERVSVDDLREILRIGFEAAEAAGDLAMHKEISYGRFESDRGYEEKVLNMWMQYESHGDGSLFDCFYWWILGELESGKGVK